MASDRSIRASARMRRPALIAAALLAGAGSACAPNPIVARDPVPAPSRAESYTCDTKALVLNVFTADCRERPRPPVLSARG